jgi:glycosyltransferase involved in cell wall biosynthesis
LTWLYRRLRVPFERWLEAACIRRAAAVVTVSEGIAALQQQAFSCRPIVIRNADDHRLHRVPPIGIRAAADVGPRDHLFVVVGNAKPGQAIAQLLQALTMVPAGVHVAFLGGGYQQYLGSIQALGLSARVHMLLPVKPFEVAPFIQSADASLLLYYPLSPTYLHCLPNGFFQAVAAGLPLLYPALPEIQRIAQRHNLGLPIDPLSPASIAGGMLAFLQQPELLSELRQNVARAREILNWESEERVLAALLDQTIDGPKARTV